MKTANEYTYIIGAGASCEVLPLVNQFVDELENFQKVYLAEFEFIDNNFPKHYNYSFTKSEIGRMFSEDLKWLIDNVRKHFSVDTFARKLYLKGDYKNYNLLKRLLSEFLLILELMNGIDRRYDSFFATILEKNGNELKLPENINLLSWNYDKQIEFSIAQFLKSKYNSYVEDFIQMIPRKEFFEPNNKFSLFKLNGTVGGVIYDGKYDPMEYDFGIKIDQHAKDNILSNSFDRYYRYKRFQQQTPFRNENEYENTINYSWENSTIVKQVREFAINQTKQTKELIIIGYSFPTFNRNLDKLILNNMSKLDKVYLQLPKNSIDSVAYRIQSLIDKEIELIKIDQVDEFYIPFSY